MNCQKFDVKCYYFYISAIVSLSLIGVCTAIIFTTNDDPCIKNTAVGILTSILTFWANPPRLNEETKKGKSGGSKDNSLENIIAKYDNDDNDGNNSNIKEDIIIQKERDNIKELKPAALTSIVIVKESENNNSLKKSK